MSENIEYWMFAATTIYFTCYLPEIYANIRNRNANIYNVPEKVMMMAGTICALVYAIRTQNTPLIINYGPLLLLDFIALSMRVYYAYLTHYQSKPILPNTIMVGETTGNPLYK
jgi:uncharacterized protein with PQ loop repeat